MARNDPALMVRFPTDIKAFLQAEASRNGSSQNSEVVRAVRERMDRQNETRSSTAMPDRVESKSA